MKLNCKPGDLAIIVASGTPENIGRIVEVICVAVQNEVFTSLSGRRISLDTKGYHCWRVRSPRPLLWRFESRSDPSADTDWFGERPIADEFLRPITGLPIDEETREELPA